MSERPEDVRPGQSDHRGESEVWSLISTLVAGPAVWGAIGAGVDALVDGPGRLWTAVGVVVGFVTSIYIVYVRSVREPRPDEDGARPGAGHRRPPTSTGDAR